MKSNITLALLLLLQSLSIVTAETFTINGKTLTVPSPKGFVRVTDDMSAVMRLVRQQADADSYNDTLAYYIKESDVLTAMEGDIPSMEKNFILKVNKKMRNMTIGKDFFSHFKSMTKSQNQQIFEDVKAQVPKNMKNLSQGVSQEFNIDFAVNISQMVPLETHYEAENALAYSMYINYGVSDEEEHFEEIISATTTFLNASGSVLFLYGYAPKDDLQWTRDSSMKWAESVVASNSQPPANSPDGRGFDWAKGSVGAIVGGLLALIASAVAILRRKA
jgi:hypothetical protein